MGLVLERDSERVSERVSGRVSERVLVLTRTWPEQRQTAGFTLNCDSLTGRRVGSMGLSYKTGVSNTQVLPTLVL